MFLGLLYVYKILIEKHHSVISFIVQTIGGFDEDALKKEWFALSLDFALQKKINLALRFDDMWYGKKQILQSQYPNNIDKYPNLTKFLNAIGSLSNSISPLTWREFSFLTDLKTKQKFKSELKIVRGYDAYKSNPMSEIIPTDNF